MPIYEFVCQECKNLVEFFIKNPKEEVALRCSSCGSSELQRVISRCNSTICDRGKGETGSAPKKSLEERSCPSGTCSTLTLPGHTR